jgi:hypothetical protein
MRGEKMKKNILRIVQITWMALALLTAYHSVKAFSNNPSYCSGMYCAGGSDCGTACFCSGRDSTCYYAGE